MARILHIADIHLGTPASHQLKGDHKVAIEPDDNRESSQLIAVRTLIRLARNEELATRPLDAIVLTGDLTSSCKREGFDAFKSLLRELKKLVPKGRIVVTPGNHDVSWNASPSTAERYSEFVRVTRSLGCITPLLDGIDVVRVNGKVTLKAADPFEHLLVLDDLVLVPLNSSNWCGVIAGPRGPNQWSVADWEDGLKGLPLKIRDRALSQIQSLLQHDMARISSLQLEGVGLLLEQCGLKQATTNDPRVRVVALHHQLVPVAQREEVKTFESITNLGQVRAFIAQWQFSAALHGHKHDKGLLWDFPGADVANHAVGGPVLIVSGPGEFEEDELAFRIIEVEGGQLAPSAEVTSVLGVRATQDRPEFEDPLRVRLWGDGCQDSGLRVTANSVAEVYTKIQALYKSTSSTLLRNLYCEVRDGGDARLLPTDYPATGTPDPQAWFEGLIDWWQLAESELVRRDVLPFNHGTRIHSLYGDQIDRAARALSEDWKTSTGLVLLLDPSEVGLDEDDPRDRSRGQYPAFALAQFSLVETLKDRYRLDVLGYFRKQEMRYWWPINVAELALMQQAVLGSLGWPLRQRTRLGRICTLSVTALQGRELPAVAVAEIDRAVEDEGLLWRLAFAIYYAGVDFADSARANWDAICVDLRGGNEGAPRPSAGLRTLIDHLVDLESVHEESWQPAVRARKRLEELLETYSTLDPEISLRSLPVSLDSALRKANTAVMRALDGG